MCIRDSYLYDYTFANDNGQNPLMDKARAYVENWKEAYKNNTGLLLFGDVGTGKSFFAGCIANALLDRDVPVLMTNFPTILNRLTGMFSEDRADFIASFDEYDLLIIDDLGVERSPEYLSLIHIYAATRYLKDLKDNGEAITPKTWQLEIDQLAAGKQTDTLAMKSMREDLKAGERLRKTAEQLSRQEREMCIRDRYASMGGRIRF